MSKHSKYKNTGLLFELLVRKVTSDTLEGKNSKALSLLRKYFVNTELGKEYRLYEYLLKHEKVGDSRANGLIDTVLSNISKLDRNTVLKQKYNLVREIREHYSDDIFFKTKIPNYKYYAAISILAESKSGDNIDLQIKSRENLFEYISGTSKTVIEEDKTLKEFESSDKSVRTLTLRILLEKFNTKYQTLSKPQKELLSEYITSSDDSTTQKLIYNKRIPELRRKLTKAIKVESNPTIKIKLEEVKKFLKPLTNRDKMHIDYITSLLQYYTLLEDLNSDRG